MTNLWNPFIQEQEPGLFEYYKRGIAAGVFITIGCIIYVALLNTCKPLGAFMFSLGLLTVIRLKSCLYTGMIGTLVTEDDKLEYTKRMLVVWLGNLGGASILGSLTLFQNAVDYTVVVDKLIAAKTNQSFITLLVMGVFCGMLMHIAVSTNKLAKSDITGTVSVILCVAVFILCGFEHCVADMGYLFMSPSKSLYDFWILGPITLGNTLGSWFIQFFIKDLFKQPLYN